jgi:hypothetical protein
MQAWYAVCVLLRFSSIVVRLEVIYTVLWQNFIWKKNFPSDGAYKLEMTSANR